MKRILFLLLFSVSLLRAQDTIKAHDVQLALNTDLTGQSVLYAAVNPSVTYFLTDHWSVGGKVTYRKQGDDSSSALMDVYSQFYLNDHLFLQPGIIADFNGVINLNGSIGYTSWMAKKWYLQPAYRLELQDKNYYGKIVVAVGYKL